MIPFIRKLFIYLFIYFIYKWMKCHREAAMETFSSSTEAGLGPSE